MVNMKTIFEVMENDNDNLTIKVIVDKEEYYLTNQIYIESDDWCFDLTKDIYDALTSSDFVGIVEEEATDDCWDLDVRISRLDSCCEGNMYVNINNDIISFSRIVTRVQNKVTSKELILHTERM